MEYDILFNSGNHGADYVGKCSDETMVEICKSYECLNVSNIHRDLLILNNFNLYRVHSDAFGRNDQSQITNFDGMEFTFVDICLQPYLLKSRKDFLYVGLMFFLRVTIDQDIINIGVGKFV